MIANAEVETRKSHSLPVNENYKTINVATQNDDPNSVLNHFRKMTKLRTSQPTLIYGAYQILQKEHPEIYAYTRTYEGNTLLILLNFSKKESKISLPELANIKEKLIDNYPDCAVKDKTATLRPYQAVVFRR